jgi:hypothetical protein
VTMSVLLSYAEDYAVYARSPKDAPPEVRARVLAVAARSVGRAN